MRYEFTAGFAFALLVSLGLPMGAQVSDSKINAIQKRLDQRAQAYQRMPAHYRDAIDGGGVTFQLDRVFRQMAPALKKIALPATRNQAAPSDSENPNLGVAHVNNSKTDLELTRFGGMTQSETSTAVCGNQVVVGFNDAGSYFETLQIPGIGLGISGVAVSRDRGASFKDVGFMPPGHNLANVAGGDPVVTCSDSNTFYYAQIFHTADASGNPLFSIGLSKSVDGGYTWSDPVPAGSKDGLTHIIDKPWSAIDPSNHNRIYVSYTDFDSSGTSAGCPNDDRVAIEVLVSNNGGQSFGSPIIIDEQCGVTNNIVQGSHIVISSNGTVNVAWEWFHDFSAGPREYRYTRFAPGGSPGPPVVIHSIVGPGSSYALQGYFRDFLGLDFAVDTSGGPTDGTLYAIWDDGRDKSIFDLFSRSGFYSFGDILVSASSDGGTSWSLFPVKVNSDTQPIDGPGHDHYQPGIAVDSTGKVAACWYDRRADPQNFKIERYCGESTDSGLTWNDFKVPVPSFGPSHDEDLVVGELYEGDYDGLAADSTKGAPGFVGAFGVIADRSNPDVRAFHFQ